jgi:hypothetical protein
MSVLVKVRELRPFANLARAAVRMAPKRQRAAATPCNHEREIVEWFVHRIKRHHE